eukprot:4302228-Pleurochrysis_carterae.AAC.2
MYSAPESRAALRRAAVRLALCDEPPVCRANQAGAGASAQQGDRCSGRRCNESVLIWRRWNRAAKLRRPHSAPRASL